MSQRSRRILQALLLSFLCGAGLASAADTHSGAAETDSSLPALNMEKNPPVYLVATFRLGAVRVTNTPRAEFRRLIIRHLAYMKDLLDRGVIYVGGTYPDHTGGVFILRVEDAEQAEQILSQDPGIISDIFRYELRPIEAHFRPEVRIVKAF